MDTGPADDDVPSGTSGGPAADEAPAASVAPGSLGPHPERHPDDLPPPERAGRGGIPSGVLWALTLAVVVLAIASWVAFSTDSSSTDADAVARLDPNVSIDPSSLEAPEVVGRPVAASAYSTFDGGTAELTGYAGRPLVVNFWASTCTACITEMPAFERVHRAGGDDVAFVGLAVLDQQGAARDLAARTGVTYDLGFDQSGDVIRQLGGVVLPTTAFVDADGTIVESHAGKLDEAELRAKIREHFGIEVPAGS